MTIKYIQSNPINSLEWLNGRKNCAHCIKRWELRTKSRYFCLQMPILDKKIKLRILTIY